MPAFVRKVQRLEEGWWLLRLSNRAIQLLAEGQNYMMQNKQLW
jgi:hypothetical protein